MPLNTEFLIEVFEETFQSDEHIKRLVLPPFKGKYGYAKPLTFTIIETEHISIGEFLDGRESKFNRHTEYVIVETKGVVGFYCKIIS